LNEIFRNSFKTGHTRYVAPILSAFVSLGEDPEKAASVGIDQSRVTDLKGLFEKLEGILTKSKEKLTEDFEK